MRAFITACIVAAAVATIAAFALNAFPDSAQVAFSTVGVRI
jgi:hypothetical protein